MASTLTPRTFNRLLQRDCTGMTPVVRCLKDSLHPRSMVCIGTTLAMLLAGCAQLPVPTDWMPGSAKGLDTQGRATHRAEQHLSPVLIIADLVSALEFALPSMSTTIQVNPGSGDVVGQQFAAGIAAAGYGIQWVGGDEGAFFFSYSIKEGESGRHGVGEVYRISVGPVYVERSYTLSENGNVIPDSALLFGGSQARVALNDMRFETAQPLSIEVSQVNYMDAVPMDETAPAISLLSGDTAR